MMKNDEIRIEFPSRGRTYCRAEFGVYAYGTYGRGSVLAGQESRTFLDSFDTLADARAAFPMAENDTDPSVIESVMAQVDADTWENYG